MRSIVMCLLASGIFLSEGVFEETSVSPTLSKILNKLEKMDISREDFETIKIKISVLESHMESFKDIESMKTQMALLQSQMESSNKVAGDQSPSSFLDHVLDNTLKLKEFTEEIKKMKEEDLKLAAMGETLGGFNETLAELEGSIFSLNRSAKSSAVSSEPKQEDPCDPSPCGPVGQCTRFGSTPICSCGKWNLGDGRQLCDFDCTENSNCTTSQTCVDYQCKSCSEICGDGAQCKTTMHLPVCACKPGETGDPMVKCCSGEFVQLNDKCYYFSTKTKTRDAAQRDCISKSAGLVSIETAGENIDIRVKLTEIRPMDSYRTSLYKYHHVWRWNGNMEGFGIRYTHWYSGHPTGSSSKICMFIQPYTPFKWYAQVCTEQHLYICEN